MAYPAALVTEVKSAAYTGRPEGEVADAINAKLVNGSQPVNPMDVRRILLRDGSWAKLEIAARNTDATAIQALTVMRTFDGFFSLVDFSDSSLVGKVGAALNALVTASVITAAAKNAIAALNSTDINGNPVKVRFPVSLGIADILPSDVSIIRSS